ncbi:MAG TPA: hypothetical protein VE422_33295 [Terriglobia bacterium]|nr:hypothetical protein [Terriglobia bacterium]
MEPSEPAAPEPSQPPPPSQPQPPRQLDFVQPALAGGMFLGLLSSLPVIQLGNCFFCMWVLGGGGIAAFLLTKQRPEGITYGDGAFGGVLSGLFGAGVATAVSIPMRIITARVFGDQQQALEQAMKDVPGWEGPVRDIMLRIASPEISAVTIIATFFMNLIFFALFAMIGGILAVAILNKKKIRMKPK